MGLLIYFLKEAVRGFYQAKLMTVASVISIAASLFLMSLIAIALLNVQNLIAKASEQADIAAYLSDNVAGDSIGFADLVDQIRKFPQVDNVVAISKDSAWERFAAINGSEILESVDENPLPASMEILPAQAVSIR